MADLVFRGTVRYRTMFDVLDKRPEHTRSAALRVLELNPRIIKKERGLGGAE
jgi:hypothetical protein